MKLAAGVAKLEIFFDFPLDWLLYTVQLCQLAMEVQTWKSIIRCFHKALWKSMAHRLAQQLYKVHRLPLDPLWIHGQEFLVTDFCCNFASIQG